MRKKLLVVLTVAVLLFSSFVYAHSLYDSVPTSSQNSFMFLRDLHPGDTDDSAAGYVWNYTTNTIIHRVTFYLKKSNSPVGDLKAYIYAVDGSDLPTGAVLAESMAVSAASLTESFDTYDFYFNYTELYTLVANTEYAIVLQTPASGTFDVSNYVVFGLDSSPAGGDPTYVFYDDDPGGWETASNVPIFYSYSYADPTPGIDLGYSGSAGDDDFVLFNVTLDPTYYTEYMTNTSFLFQGSDSSENFTMLWTESSGAFTETGDSGSYATLNGGTEYLVDFDTLVLEYNITLASAITSGTANITITYYTDVNSTDSESFNYQIPTSLWDVVLSFLDSAASLFGVTNLALVTYATGVLAYIKTALTGMLSLVIQVYRVINGTFTWTIRWVTRIISFWIDVFTAVVQILNGTHSVVTGVGNIWSTINFSEWYDFIPVILGIGWMASLDSRAPTEGFARSLWNDISTMINLLSFFFTWFSFVISTGLDLVFWLLDRI